MTFGRAIWSSKVKVVYKAVQRGCVSFVGVTIVNAGVVFNRPVILLQLSNLPIRPPRLGLEERL